MMLTTAAAIGIAAPAFAQLPVPSVQAPVPVPTVQVPPVPTVQVPDVPVPQVPVPDVPAPSVPGVTPPPPPPSGGGGGGSSGGGGESSGASSGSPSAGGSSSSGGSSSGRSGSSHSSAASRGGSSSGGGATTTRRASRDSSSRRPPASGGRAAGGSSRGPETSNTRQRERQLRETVAKASSCLDDLSTGQRRVLTLRAGIGAGPPRSRRGVARRLDISVRRVVRLERTGLQRLRSLARGAGCVPPSDAGGSRASGAGLVESGAAATALGSSSTAKADKGKDSSGGGSDRSSGGGSSSDGSRGEPENEGDSGGGDRGGVAGETLTNLPEGSRGDGTGFLIPLILILLALALAARALVPIVRRRMAERAVVAAAPVPARRATFEDTPREPAAEPAPVANTAPSFDFPPRGETGSWDAPSPETESGQWAPAPPPPPPEPGSSDDAGWASAPDLPGRSRVSR